MPLKEEIWYCSHCGHEVNPSDEFCFACESVFAGTAMAARRHLANRLEENGAARNRPEPRARTSGFVE